MEVDRKEMSDKININQVQAAKKTFGINDWSNGYFDINNDGDVVINHPSSHSIPVSVMSIIEEMRDKKLQMPVLLRVENILDQSITSLNETFAETIEAVGYDNHYRGVYPIKVNQQAHIVEDIANFGEKYQHGFEVGSKAEMVAALSTLHQPHSLIICNGYKDQEFIDLGLQATKLGFLCIFVIENTTELPIIIARSQTFGIKPHIGVRVKMTSHVSGHWNSTSGDRSVFGLTASQLIHVVDELNAHQMLDCLELLHCHLGSQIPSISDIRDGVVEACRYYANLCLEGANMAYIDLGGGLAVDYTGAQSNAGQSCNYTLQDYCENIVHTIKTTLDTYDLKHPVIITESGRATVAYSSILIFNVLDVTKFEAQDIADASDDEHAIIQSMRDVLDCLNPEGIQACYNDAHRYRDEIRALFKRGQIDLRLRSLSENLFLQVLQGIDSLLKEMETPPVELDNLTESLADIYYGNFSLFQSLPDSWAIDQLFPIMPIHRLNEALTRKAIIADITCDCDGKVDRFISKKGHDNTLPLHPLKDGEEYYLGIFLVGAYQETLGDLHNLFGDTNVVSVRLNDDSSFDFVKEIQGDSISDVLSYVEYEPKKMTLSFQSTVEAAVHAGRITTTEQSFMIDTFNASLQGYTYYEKEEPLSQPIVETLR